MKKYEAVSTPHPSKSALKRDINDKLIPVIDGKRLRVQKRTFTKHIEDMYILSGVLKMRI